MEWWEKLASGGSRNEAAKAGVKADAKACVDEIASQGAEVAAVEGYARMDFSGFWRFGRSASYL